MKHKRIYAEAPAAAWCECYPLGNGRIGIMNDGGIAEQLIYLNDDRLWSGNGADKTVRAGKDAAEAVRLALNADDFHTAEAILQEQIYGEYTESYLPLGTLKILRGINPYNYKRELSLDNATHTVTADGYLEESFVSRPDECCRIRSEFPRCDIELAFDTYWQNGTAWEKTEDGLRLKVKGRAPSHADPVYHQTDNPIVYDADNPGREFACVIEVVTDGVTDNNKISGATKLDIVITAEAAFRKESDILKSASERAARLSASDYSVIRERHIADYLALYAANALELDNAEDARPTEKLLNTPKRKRDNTLYELLYSFGRYLLISSSRPGTEAATLQGIWNADPKPPWSSNYTININTEMNYWCAETTNLSELHLPLIKLIRRASERGRKVAAETFHCRGWCIGHNTDIWGHANPVGKGANASTYALCVSACGWLCQHIYEHYAFTGDKAFLAENIDLIEGAVQFYLDYMTLDDKSGKYVTSPTTSPENSFRYKGVHSVNKCSALDIAVIRELFGNYLTAARILDLNTPLIGEAERMLARLMPYAIDSGRIREWYGNYRECDRRHRHLSHLYGLYPGSEITPDTPNLYQAARRSLKRRGLGGTGWAKAWKIGLYARLKDGNTALKCLDSQLTPVNANAKMALRGGTYSSMLCAHPPFQIDGNLGAAAGIAEMLIGSHGGILELLPALPDKWRGGSLKGARARGGYTADFKWADGKVTYLKVIHPENLPVKLRLNGSEICVDTPYEYIG